MSSSPSAVDFEQLTPTGPVEPAPSLAEAAQKARRLVAAAEAEADRIRDEARAVGYEEGFEAGRSEARAEFAPTAEAVTTALEGVRALEAELADRVEAQAVDLAMHVAERVVSGVVAVEPARLLDVVRGALRTIVERERVTVLVHPEDLDLIRESVSELTGSLGGMEHLEVQEERRVGRGGAIIRTSFGEVDARIETKLARAREAVEKELSA
jgi:flagellar assembly protein FliH